MIDDAPNQLDRGARGRAVSGMVSAVRAAPAAVLLLLALVPGCKTRDVEIVAGPNADVAITLVNPTTCSDCDPFADIDSLRLDIVQPDSGSITDSVTSPWPGDLPTLPDLAGFGVVRVELTGLNGTRTLSKGRTAAFVVEPGQPTTIPMLFLPADTPVPLTAQLSLERSRHLGWTRRDGQVVLLGGVDPSGSLAFASTEVFDPATHTFGLDTTASVLPVDPAFVEEEDGDLLITGGAAASGARLANAWVYALAGEGEQGVLEAQDDLAEPRSHPCVARVGAQKGVVMGGVDAVDGATSVDVMRYGTDAWAFDAVGVQGLDNRAVRGCVGLDDGRVFVLGTDATATGFFSYPDEGAVAFAAVGNGGGDQFVSGAALVADEDRVLILGGYPSNGQPGAQTWHFDPSTASFASAPSLAEARVDPDVWPWLDPGVLAIGCGWSNASETIGNDTVELFDADAGTVSTVTLDRARPGCSLNVLPDGALLIAGGFDANDAGQVGAVVIVPG